MVKFYRDKLYDASPLGSDSIQGILMMTDWYCPNGEKSANLILDVDRYNEIGTLEYHINHLKEEGYIDIRTSPYESESEPERNFVLLENIGLTVKGHQLLDELKKKSRIGRLKDRFSNIIWTVITASITTIVILELKGL